MYFKCERVSRQALSTKYCDVVKFRWYIYFYFYSPFVTFWQAVVNIKCCFSPHHGDINWFRYSILREYAAHIPLPKLCMFERLLISASVRHFTEGINNTNRQIVNTECIGTTSNQSATFHTSTCRHQTFLLFFSCLPKIIKVSEYLYDLRFIHISFITKFWSDGGWANIW